MSDSGHNIYWKNSLKLSSNYTISGYSRAAENTGFYCSELDMAFDAGLQMNEMPSFICLTHLHNDHFCNLNKMLIENPKNPIIFIPNNDKFEELLNMTLKLIYLSSKFIHPNSEKGQDPTRKYPYRIVKLDIGQSYEFKKIGTGGIYVEGLPAEHGVGCISFGIYESRRRCQEKYKGLKSSEYIQLKKDGIDFTEEYKVPILCFMSDTNIKPLLGPQAELIFQYPVIIIECSFLEEDDLSKAKKKNHIHWSQLEPLIKDHSKSKFILTHFSKRYMWTEIKNFFYQYMSTNGVIDNVILWLQSGVVDYSMLEKK
jgi:ribonuclease Z